MITVRLLGGMGNQMFQYAMGLAQALALDVDLQLDTSCLGRHQCIAPLWGLQETLASDVKPTVEEKGMPYNKTLDDSIKDGDCLNGYWQTEKYFEHIRAILLKKFVPRPTDDSRFYEFHDQILHDENSVSLHVRHGDYLNPGTKEFHGVLQMDYYDRAIEMIRSGLNARPSLYIFSDDPEWVAKNFHRHQYKFVETRDDACNIFLMSRCRHNIIANSSYSWWGAWLGLQNDRIVIAPLKWFDQAKEDTKDIIPNYWTRV